MNNEYFDISSKSNTESTFFDVFGGKEESKLSGKHKSTHHRHNKHNLIESVTINFITHVVNTSMEVIIEMG